MQCTGYCWQYSIAGFFHRTNEQKDRSPGIFFPASMPSYAGFENPGGQNWIFHSVHTPHPSTIASAKGIVPIVYRGLHPAAFPGGSFSEAASLVPPSTRSRIDEEY